MPKVNKELSIIEATYAEFYYRRGFSEKFDMGFKLTLIGTFSIDGKYNLYDSKKFAVATGLGLSHASLKNEGYEKITIIDITFPLHTSYHINDNFAVYISPKYNIRIADNNQNMLGATFRARIGNKFGLYLESSYYMVLDIDSPVVQVNAALFF